MCERTYSGVRRYTESVLSIRQKGDGGFCVFILRPPKLVRMRVRVRIRVHVTGGVLARGLTCVGRLSEQPHWRWPKQGAAVAKQGGLASWVASARYTIRKGGQRKVQSYFDQSCGSIRPQLYSFLPCTLLWPYSSKVYLVLATALLFFTMVQVRGRVGTPVLFLSQKVARLNSENVASENKINSLKLSGDRLHAVT